MLLSAIVYSLPMAVGVALSPLPIATVVTILLSARPNNAPAFLLGWITGILGIGGTIFLIPGLDTARGEPTVLSGWIRLGLGGVLLMLAVLVRLEGRNPELYDGFPVAFNIDLSGSLPELLQASLVLRTDTQCSTACRIFAVPAYAGNTG